MADYEALAATAASLIDSNGQDITITREDFTDIDPVTQVDSGAGTDRSGRFRGVPLPMGGRSNDPASLIDREILDVWIDAVSAPFPPVKGDIALINGEKRSLVKVEPYLIDGVTTVVYRAFAELSG
jgi:hypothetical protein